MNKTNILVYIPVHNIKSYITLINKTFTQTKQQH